MKFIYSAITFFVSIALMQAQTANVQFINNSGDEAVQYVDIYLDDQRVIDSLEFREATPYFSVPANTSVVVSLQDPSINDTVGALYSESFNLMADSNYVMIATGIYIGGVFDSIKPFDVAVHKGRITSKVAGETDVLAYHGVTDGPGVEINETSVAVPNLIDNLNYGEFQGYLQLANNDYTLEVAYESTGNTLARYSAPLNSYGLADSAIVVVASGFVDTVKTNPGGGSPIIVPKFGLYAALPSGGPLVELPIVSGLTNNEIHTSGFDIYPVPARDYVILEIKNGQNLTKATLMNLNGQVVQETRPQTTGDHRYRFNLGEVSKGVYLLQYSTEEGKSYQQEVLVR